MEHDNAWEPLAPVGFKYPDELRVYWREFHTEDEESKQFLLDPLGGLVGLVPDVGPDWEVSTTIVGHHRKLMRWPLVWLCLVLPEQRQVVLTGWKRDPGKDPSYRREPTQAT